MYSNVTPAHTSAKNKMTIFSGIAISLLILNHYYVSHRVLTKNKNYQVGSICAGSKSLLLQVLSACFLIYFTFDLSLYNVRDSLGK